MPSLGSIPDLVTSQSALQNYWSAPQLLLCGRTQYRIAPGAEKWLGLAWKGRLRFQNVAQVKAAVIVQKGYAPLAKAVDTIEESVSIQSEESATRALELLDESSSTPLSSSSEREPEPELDDFEKVRRLRISKANKGKIPWNRGRKHTPETIQLIRERTWTAMQDPKVRLKLSKLGYVQSDETKKKIGEQLRELWQRRREKMMVQDKICFEWQHAIAEASRKGYSVEEELQWDAYEQWKELAVIVEKRETSQQETSYRPRDYRTGPKSPEHRKKIAKAIAAKWADPEYQQRVCLAMKRSRSVSGTGEGPRRRTLDHTKTKEKVERKGFPGIVPSRFEAQVIEDIAPQKKRMASPTYKDPMAETKLKMIKKIRQQRSVMENQKRKATANAKLLIAEAEKAVKALEGRASTSPLVQASVLESKRLIAEAIKYIEISEKGETPTQEAGRNINIVNWTDSQVVPEKVPSDTTPQDPEKPLINGYDQQSSTDLLERSFHSEESTTVVALNGLAPSTAISKYKGAEVNGRPPFQLKAAAGMLEQPVKVASPNRHTDSGTQDVAKSKDASMQAQKPGSSTASAGKTKRWICGRLVEVELGV